MKYETITTTPLALAAGTRVSPNVEQTQPLAGQGSSAQRLFDGAQDDIHRATTVGEERPMDLPDVTFGTFLIVIGIICIIAGAGGATFKAIGGVEIGAVEGISRALISAVGIMLVIWGVHRNDEEKFHIVGADIQWDYADTDNGPCGKEPFTLSLTTAGSKGGKLTYRLYVDNRPEKPQTVELDGTGDYPITGEVSIAAAAKDGTGKAELRASVLSPQHFNSETSTLKLGCYTPQETLAPVPKTSTSASGRATPEESQSKLIAETGAFLKDYSKAVAQYGREAPEVTDVYLYFPLEWYRAGSFEDAAAYRKYVLDGRAKSRQKQNKTSKRPCTYTPAVVTSATPSEDGTILVVSVINWARTDQTAAGEILVDYTLVRDSSGKLLIEKASQNTYTTPCD